MRQTNYNLGLNPQATEPNFYSSSCMYVVMSQLFVTVATCCTTHGVTPTLTKCERNALASSDGLLLEKTIDVITFKQYINMSNSVLPVPRPVGLL